MQNLTIIELDYTKIINPSGAELPKAFPNCRIYYS